MEDNTKERVSYRVKVLNEIEEKPRFLLAGAGLAISTIVYRLQKGGKIKIDDFRNELDVCSEGLDKLTSIIEEIKKNIDTLQGKERERYIFTLLRPFTDCKKLFLFYEKYPALFYCIYKGLYSKKNLFNVRDFIYNYAFNLDLLLLERGINLLWYQKEADIYILEERDICWLGVYFGTEKLAKRYIDEALPKLEPQQASEPTNTKPQQNKLPNELNTDEALKYFTKAKEIGLIDANYKWLKGKQLLACFCRDMSFKLDLGKGGRISWQPFEILFKTKKGSLRSNLNDIQKTGETPTDIYLVDKVFK